MCASCLRIACGHLDLGYEENDWLLNAKSPMIPFLNRRRVGRSAPPPSLWVMENPSEHRARCREQAKDITPEMKANYEKQLHAHRDSLRSSFVTADAYLAQFNELKASKVQSAAASILQFLIDHRSDPLVAVDDICVRPLIDIFMMYPRTPERTGRIIRNALELLRETFDAIPIQAVMRKNISIAIANNAWKTVTAWCYLVYIDQIPNVDDCLVLAVKSVPIEYIPRLFKIPRLLILAHAMLRSGVWDVLDVALVVNTCVEITETAGAFAEAEDLSPEYVELMTTIGMPLSANKLALLPWTLVFMHIVPLGLPCLRVLNTLLTKTNAMDSLTVSSMASASLAHVSDDAEWEQVVVNLDKLCMTFTDPESEFRQALRGAAPQICKAAMYMLDERQPITVFIGLWVVINSTVFGLDLADIPVLTDGLHNWTYAFTTGFLSIFTHIFITLHGIRLEPDVVHALAHDQCVFAIINISRMLPFDANVVRTLYKMRRQAHAPNLLRLLDAELTRVIDRLAEHPDQIPRVREGLRYYSGSLEEDIEDFSDRVRIAVARIDARWTDARRTWIGAVASLAASSRHFDDLDDPAGLTKRLRRS